MLGDTDQGSAANPIATGRGGDHRHDQRRVGPQRDTQQTESHDPDHIADGHEPGQRDRMVETGRGGAGHKGGDQHACCADKHAEKGGNAPQYGKSFRFGPLAGDFGQPGQNQNESADQSLQHAGGQNREDLTAEGRAKNGAGGEKGAMLSATGAAT